MARHHIEAAVGLTAAGADPNFSARAAVLSAEVILAGDDLDGALRTAEQVPGRADVTVAGHATAFANCETWADLARFIAAPRALADGWGEPARWLTAARDRFTSLGLDRLAGRCTELLRDASPNSWVGQGVTDREADVLRLVIAGLANKEIAAALRLSPRTVEKHVENLLRKTGARSRTELAVTASHPAT
jgi:DNA-binding CsgD family transcriptional regulator